MAHCRMVCLAYTLNRRKKHLLEEKLNSIRIENHETPKVGCCQRLRHCSVDCHLCLAKCCSLPQRSCLHRFLYRLRRSGSLENFLMKSVVGLVSGVFLTYLIFLFSVVQLHFHLTNATIMCSILGTVLILGLAFSPIIRCVVLLILPQFFSKRGRQVLLAYAFILSITGPAQNTLNNMGIMSESLACGQEQLKAAVKQIVDVIRKPFYAVKDAIKSVVKTVKMIVQKIKEILIKIKRLIMAICAQLNLWLFSLKDLVSVRVIKSAFQFLGKILNVCNKELGTPFERCTRVFDNVILDCTAKLGPHFSWLCSITYLIKTVCYIVKPFDVICMLVDFISNSIIGVVVKKVKSFVRHIRTMFYVRIKFSHSFQFNTNSSKSYSEIAKGIVGEIKGRTQFLSFFFDIANLISSFFFFFLIIKTLHYRMRFLINESYDNKYITRDFRLIDLQRAKWGRETVLPLNRRERKKYVDPRSCRLAIHERRQLTKSAVALLAASLKLGFQMFIDYSLFWLLDQIRYHARFQSKVPAPNLPDLNIQGEGLLADLLKCIVNAFKPLGMELEINTIPCLPNPIPPDYDRYVEIGSTLVLCWLLTIFEPYGLRLRSIIMCYYHPLRARQRSVWLFNNIMRSRISFLKFARRQLRRNTMGDQKLAKITFIEFLKAKFNCCRNAQEACLLCGEVFRESDKVKPIRCATPGCVGLYCMQCFEDLKNLCTVCLSPIEYGDLSDISEEKGSDEEDDDDQNGPGGNLDKRYKDPKDDDDDEEKLLKLDNNQDNVDTSGNTSDSSEHSFTYQYEKTSKHDPLELDSGSQKVIQKQDYANMEEFEGVVCTDEESISDIEKIDKEEVVPMLAMKNDKMTGGPSTRSLGTSMHKDLI